MLLVTAINNTEIKSSSLASLATLAILGDCIRFIETNTGRWSYGPTNDPELDRVEGGHR